MDKFPLKMGGKVGGKGGGIVECGSVGRGEGGGEALECWHCLGVAWPRVNCVWCLGCGGGCVHGAEGRAERNAE